LPALPKLARKPERITDGEAEHAALERCHARDRCRERRAFRPHVRGFGRGTLGERIRIVLSASMVHRDDTVLIPKADVGAVSRVAIAEVTRHPREPKTSTRDAGADLEAPPIERSSECEEHFGAVVPETRILRSDLDGGAFERDRNASLPIPGKRCWTPVAFPASSNLHGLRSPPLGLAS
jgi:hypothetical protein